MRLRRPVTQSRTNLRAVGNFGNRALSIPAFFEEFSVSPEASRLVGAPVYFYRSHYVLRKFPQAGVLRNANIVVMVVTRFAAISDKVHDRAFSTIFVRVYRAERGVLDQSQQHRLIIIFLRAPSAVGPYFERADYLLRFGIDEDLGAEPEAVWRKHDRPVAGDFG